MFPRQFVNTIQLIISSSHLNKFISIYRHLFWQVRKILNLYPYQLKISNSKVNVTDKHNGVLALVNCMEMYDYNNMNLIKALTKEGGVFFDIGANVGTYTLIASEQEKARICSFEAHPQTCSELLENIKLNNRKNIDVFNVAVSERNGTVYFSNLAENPLNQITYSESADSICVESVRMDTFIEKNKIFPDFVKIDVEGWEYNVLISFGKYISSVKVFFIELNDFTERRFTGSNLLIDYLSKNNFDGPFSFHYDRLHLSAYGLNKEDGVFISKKYFDMVSGINTGFKMI